jgi:hypothetical protein
MTIKTKAQLDTLFADNSTGAISEADLRDFVDSIMGVYGSIVFEANAVTQTVASGVPEQLTEWTGDGISNGTTPAYASDQITIDHTGIYQVSFQASFQGLATKIQEFELRVDGAVTGVKCHRYTSAADVGSCSFTCQISLTAAAVLSIWVEVDGAGAITVEEAQFTVHRIA